MKTNIVILSGVIIGTVFLGGVILQMFHNLDYCLGCPNIGGSQSFCSRRFMIDDYGVQGLVYMKYDNYEWKKINVWEWRSLMFQKCILKGENLFDC